MSRTLLVAVLLLAGCFPSKTVVVDGYKLAEAKWAAHRTQVASKASFELSCPVEQVEIVVLEASDYFDVVRGKTVYASVVGARGCGRKVTYANFGDVWERSEAP
jgi:hypothetical protein